jgi:hypothetical protein
LFCPSFSNTLWFQAHSRLRLIGDPQCHWRRGGRGTRLGHGDERMGEVMEMADQISMQMLRPSRTRSAAPKKLQCCRIGKSRV